MATYIHQLKDWPQFYWDEKEIIGHLGEVRHLQGKLLGKVEMLGFESRNDANLESLIQDVVQSSEIEGEVYNPEWVRSSIAVRLGLEDSGVAHSDRNIEGVVEMMLDATQTPNKTLDKERLFGWHAALFPTGRSGMYKVETGQWRTHPMQVVSGALARPKVHFEAPEASILEEEMEAFIEWFNSEHKLDPIVKAALAHFWFVTLHPFDDGNGRIARALADMQLSIADGVNQRYYSMSAAIKNQKKMYYKVLEDAQKSDLDITEWMKWFLDCLKQAILSSNTVIEKVIYKHQFWTQNHDLKCNERQKKMINKLLDHFKGKLTTGKWAKITKTSQDTALRDITDLLQKGILHKSDSGGRSTHYVLNRNAK